MKNAYKYILLLSLTAWQYANAGCSFLPTFPKVIGNYTYDTINSTYYCHEGDTLLFIYTGTGGGDSYIEDYFFNGQLIGSNLDTIKVFNDGTYSVEHGCSLNTFTYSRTFVFSAATAVTTLSNADSEVTAYFDRTSNSIIVFGNSETTAYYDTEVFSVTGQKISELKNLSSDTRYSLPCVSKGLNIIRITDTQGKSLMKKVMSF